MQFVQEESGVGGAIGYAISYLLFTTILFFILFWRNFFPLVPLSYLKTAGITFVITLTAYFLRRWLS